MAAAPASTPAATKAVAPQPSKSFQVYNEDAGQQHLERTGFLAKLKVPTVVLETPSVSHTMAAALSLSLLNHTLFLKNQVPFPVAQLSRMPGGKSNPKVAKKREELLANLDTLASHLQTTFVALSTAHARCKSAYTQSPSFSRTTDENEDPEGELRHVTSVKEGRRGTAHLMFVLGTSVGAARARILLTIDGLEVKVWGARADDPASQSKENSTKSEDEDSDEEDSDSGKEDSDSDAESDESETGSDEDGSEAEDNTSGDEDTVEDEESDSESGPPSSRSPTPESPLARSRAPSPESIPSTPVLPRSLPAQQAFTFSHPLPSAAAAIRAPEPLSVSAPPRLPLLQTQSPQARPSASPNAAQSNQVSHAEEQQALRAAERLLSRTLINAWADGEGDMATELAPTQTHIYLRAPRRFVHPAWAARQNLTRSLDGVLDAFLEDAGAVSAPAGAKKAKSRGVRTEGAWIGCRGGSAFADKPTRSVAEGEETGPGESEEDEGDEEIWWAWEGKIVGFADW
ncbi:hypothetical protein K466DRAFT_575407 [Polyporus arcularius HHB13444]|uniref:Uncharacterized protein n=1 Tax=Polyporus arcularius HHB13444 TaxID=1314778 RepID=A0A5C3PF46_9APHY|nr:hypothetical protein K466DRAFT_575407 [Polyporus arcularius HHB13444]